MEQNGVALFQELELEKLRLVGVIDKVIQVAQESAERIQILEKSFNDTKWYLGEEKAKTKQLENDLEDLRMKYAVMEAQHCQETTLVQTEELQLV